MILPRIIPCLLLSGKGLVKGINFRKHQYVGDPINAVYIFNEKEVDELLFLDVSARKENRIPPLDLVEKIADECLMPFGVGGGITNIQEIRNLLSIGAEKVCICTAAIENPNIIKEAADTFGSQSIIVSIDVKKNTWGKYEVYKKCGTKSTGLDPVEYAMRVEKSGAGEILINSIDKDGTMNGYDLEIIKKITDIVSIPVIACGGAGKYSDLAEPINNSNCSASAAGSLFVFHGPRKAVLINYPSKEELEQIRGK